jgi:hypothetical protein
MKASKTDRLFVIIALLFWTSCQSQQQDSVLVLAFEQLSSEDLNCSEERFSLDSGLASGLALMCNESIRFTHAFTTSLQPAAAMGSLLTATYPIQHRLRSNSDRIDSSFDLLSDVAYKKNYRTGFFSGSPSILKKSGLSRSFEIFDDSIASQDGRFSWPISNQITQLSNWIFDEKKPFLGIVYFANFDLNQPISDEDDEKLFTLFEALKKRGLWDKSHIILTGLRGQNKYSRVGETAFSNLHSENTNVAFLYKPPRQKGDDGISWKSDNLISLADIGHSLFCLFNACPSRNNETPAALPEILQTQDIQSSISDQKIILIEAANPFDSNQVSFALRSKTNLFLNSPQLQYFNTLADRSEAIDSYDIRKTEADFFELSLQKILFSNPSRRNQKWSDYKQIDFVQNNLSYWQKTISRQLLIENSNDSSDPLFALNTNADLSKFTLNNPCLKIFKKTFLNHDDLKFCDDGLLLSLIRLKHYKDLNLNKKNMELNYRQLKREQLNTILRASKNVSLENAWSLYRPNANWDISYKYLSQLPTN